MVKRAVLFTLLATGLFLSASAYAEHSMNGGSVYGRHGGESQCPVADKFMRKAHFLLENQADLGLTADQAKAIQDIELQVEKSDAQQSADRKIFMLDLKSKLGEDKVDVEGTNALIDKSFASAAAATKANVEAYAKLKSTLTPEQSAKIKELFKNKKEQWKNKS